MRSERLPSFNVPRPRKRNLNATIGWVLFEPDQFWRVVEFEVNVVWPGVQEIKALTHGKFEYARTTSGLPVLKQLVVQAKGRSTKPPDTVLNQEIKTDFAIDENEPPATEFGLSAFGFSEPPGIQWKKPLPLWWLYAGGTTLGCFLIAGFFYRRKQRAATMGG